MSVASTLMAKPTSINTYRIPASSRMAAPIIKVSAPRAAPPAKKKRRSGGGGGGGGDSDSRLVGLGVAAGLVGLAKSAGYLDKLPEVPFVGRIGAVAIAAHFWSKAGGGQMAKDIKKVAVILAAYQLGNQGKIDGEDD